MPEASSKHDSVLVQNTDETDIHSSSHQFLIASLYDVNFTGADRRYSLEATSNRNSAAGKTPKKASSNRRVKSNKRQATLTRGPNRLSLPEGHAGAVTVILGQISVIYRE